MTISLQKAKINLHAATARLLGLLTDEATRVAVNTWFALVQENDACTRSTEEEA